MRKKMFWASLLLIAVGIPIVIFFFFKRNDAPILQGKVDLGIKYKDEFQLDIYEPTKEVYSKRPVLVYYHGGAWISGSKMTVNNTRFHGAFNELRDQGYAIISPSYTLAKFKFSPFPACIADAFDVISWIEQNASTYNFDIDNVGVLGESAGGHLALMTAYADIEKFTTPHSVTLNYVVGVYPPTDLYELHLAQQDMQDRVKASTVRLPQPMQEYFDINQYLFGFDSEKDPDKANELAELYSPIHYVKTEIPSTLLIHGNADRIVPIAQSISLKERIESIGLAAQFHTLDSVDHAFLNATQEQKEQIQKWITDFVLSQYVK